MPSALLMPTSRHPVAEELLHLLLVSAWAVAPEIILTLWEPASTGIPRDKLLPKPLVPLLLHTELSEHWGEAGHSYLSQLSTQNYPSVSSGKFKLVPVLSGSDWSQDSSWFQRSKKKGEKDTNLPKRQREYQGLKMLYQGFHLTKQPAGLEKAWKHTERGASMGRDVHFTVRDK